MNTNFDNKKFTTGNEYLHYGDDHRFVARFKNGGKAAFKKFLRDNFTVEEYFALLDSGLAPLKVLETKGYVSPNVCKVLKAAGYPLTLAGKKAYIENVVAARTPDVSTNTSRIAITITEEGK